MKHKNKSNMKLIIKNFRSIIYRKVTIDDFSLILLDAENGRGKSTICKSLTWCLYGNMNDLENNNGLSFGDGRTNVELIISTPKQSFSVNRLKKPDELKVKIFESDGREHEYIGPGAQSVINSKFGTNDVWNACSYLEHKTPHPLLNGASSTKTKLLTNLAFGGDDSDEIRKKIVEKLKLKAKQEHDNVCELSGAVKLLKEKSSGDPKVSEDIDSINKFIEKQRKELLDLEKKIREIREINLEKNHFEDDLEKTRAKIKKIKSLKFVSEDELIASEKAIKALVKVPEQIKSASKYIKELSEWSKVPLKESIKSQFKINDIRYTVDNEIKKHEKALKINLMHDNYEKYVKIKRYGKYLEILDKCSKPEGEKPCREDFERYTIKELVCPCCEMGLIIKNGILVKGKSNYDMREEYSKKILELTRLDKEYAEYENNNRISEALKCEKPDNYDIWLSEGSKIYAKPEIGRQSITKTEEEIASMREFLKLDLPKVNLSVRLDSIIEIIEQAGEFLLLPSPEYTSREILIYRNRNNDHKMLKTIETEIINKLSKLQEVNLGLDETTLNNKSEKLKLKIIESNRLLESAKRREELIEYNNKLTSSMEYAKNMDKLNTIINKVVSESIDNIVSNINSTTNIILGELFADPMVFTLASTKIIKTGSDRLKFSPSLKIRYKGKEQPIDSFSDGEYCLISLALVLAMSRLYTSKILILDEVFACLSEENKDLAFTVLKKWANNLTVITICHGVNIGYFDNIINL